ncbi:MAG: nuclear transport factor 2 family protein [Pseudomonadota bacterium]
MTEIETAKALVAQHLNGLDHAAPGAELTAHFARTHAPDHTYRGMRPFYDLSGAEAVAETVWSPFKAAATTLQRRPDMVIASRDALSADAPVWVANMGHLLADMTGDWLGIPAQNRTIFLPYATLHRVDGAQIIETVEFLDILSLLTQAGRNPYAPHQTGAHLMAPGPKTHDGLGPHAEQNTEDTHRLTLAMLTDLATSYTSPAGHMTRFWHADMNWFGPAGIGSSLGFPGYRRGHTGPFEDKLDTQDILDWELSIAEGNFSAVMWWPCLRMTNTGGYMGVPASEALAEMRVIDLYRRDGDKLAENWIFIDMLHFLAAQGVDLLETAP